MPASSSFNDLEFPCRHCGSIVSRLFADLGMTPLCQTQISAERYDAPEPFFPLQAYVCEACLLVQLRDCVSSEDVFTEDYPYFSSYSPSWVEHARVYADQVLNSGLLDPRGLVVEIASNDGYLLQHFKYRKVSVLGIEPSRSVANACIAKGIPTEVLFFGRDVAKSIRAKHGPASLLIGNNVLAHVPDVNDFVQGMSELLEGTGFITMEFPHLKNLIEQNQFDTIYHEHFSYFSLHAVARVLESVDLALFDVEKLATHGGSLRIFAQHGHASRPISDNVRQLLREEEEAGMLDPNTYSGFAERARATKRSIVSFLIDAKERGKRIGGYGAPGKGNTLLNYCGIGTDLIEFTVDANPVKQHTFAPGSRIPIYAPEYLRQARPDYVFILPWNLREEIMDQTGYIRDWGGQWVTPIPEIRIWP